MSDSIKSVVRVLHRAEDGLLITALLSMLVMALVQIFLRNFFDTGIFWAESFLRIVVLWVGVLGGMVATRRNSHITVDVISRYLPARRRRWTDLIANLFAAGICGLVAWHSVELIRFEYEDRTIAFGAVPMWFCQSILPFGFGVMAARFVVHASRSFLPAGDN